jgi:hypothetical protein
MPESQHIGHSTMHTLCNLDKLQIKKDGANKEIEKCLRMQNYPFCRFLAKGRREIVKIIAKAQYVSKLMHSSSQLLVTN